MRRRGNIASGATISPIPTSGLTVWLRPEEVSGLADGEKLLTWPAAPGTTLEATLENTASAAVDSAGDLNGHTPVLFESAGTDRLVVDASAAINGQTAGTLMVLRDRLSANGAPQVSSESTSSGTAAHWPWTDGTTYDRNLRTGRVTVGSGPGNYTTPTLVRVSSSASDGWRFNTNGVNRASASHSWPTITKFALGGWVANGNYGDNSYYYEVMYWTRVLTQEEHWQVHSYLNDKYGLSLPTS